MSVRYNDRRTVEKFPQEMIALIGAIAIGFVLGAVIGPRVGRKIAERSSPPAPTGAPGATSFSGPPGAEGGGYDGEPLE